MKTALVTGASSGIGAEFARQLAAKKINLVLIARSEDKLQELALQLQSRHGIQTYAIAQDLTVPQAGSTIFEKIQHQGLRIDLLVNNAGFGDYGTFSDRPLEKQLSMIQLNVNVLVELTGLFLPAMKKRGEGGYYQYFFYCRISTFPQDVRLCSNQGLCTQLYRSLMGRKQRNRHQDFSSLSWSDRISIL